MEKENSRTMCATSPSDEDITSKYGWKLKLSHERVNQHVSYVRVEIVADKLGVSAAINSHPEKQDIAVAATIENVLQQIVPHDYFQLLERNIGNRRMMLMINAIKHAHREMDYFDFEQKLQDIENACSGVNNVNFKSASALQLPK
jgi:hypothetical protein